RLTTKRYAVFAANRVVVSRAVKDLSGDPLDTPADVEFNTGTTVSSGQVSSVIVTPTAAILNVFFGTILTPTLRDAAGNTPVGHQVTWTNSDSSVVALYASDTGSTVDVVGLKAGTATITATSDG